jgi:3-oxoacyl-[acyl-carrier protein] reductase
MKLNGKIALVTGSSRGIGKIIAEKFAQEGAFVIITYIKNKKIAEKIHKTLPNSLVLQLDISKKKSIENAIEQILKKWGRIDILVNNAGVNDPKDFEEITEKDWDFVLDTNLKGTFLISQKIFSIMKKQNFGRIINISSISGQYGGPRTVHYAVSKAGVISLGHCLSRWGAPHNITANNIAPGIIATEMSKDILKTKLGKEIIDKVLLKRPGTSQEVANLAIFLASEESSYITGQTYNVNGGLILS